MEKGTLYQLRELINRRNVVSDVTKYIAACEEFTELIAVAHVLSAAIHITGVPDLAELSTRILSSDNQFAAFTSIDHCKDIVL